MKLLPLIVLAAALNAGAAMAQPPHNIVIFVADGLRYGSVEPGNMPNMAALKTAGVDFTNSHSLYPTITTVNGSAIATGHYIGDTGDFANTLWTGMPLDTLKGSPVGFVENDKLLAELNAKFGGNYLHETTLAAAARAAGWQTAIFGKEGPARIQDSTATPGQTLIVDDSTGHETGLALPQWFQAGLAKAHVELAMPKSNIPNIEQEVNMMKAATRIVLPHFKEGAKPFLLVFWSRDPDVSQHGTRDSLGELVPGINGPSGKAGTRDADSQLGELMAALKAQGLDQSTDIFVTADHGFTTVAHDSKTSPSLQVAGAGKELTSGFLAVDLALALKLPLRNPGEDKILDTAKPVALASGSGILGADAAHPDVVVTANGGSDLIYLPGKDAKSRAAEIVKFLSGQDYVSGLFVNDDLGKIPGALPMSAVNLMGAAVTPRPGIYVNMRSFSTGCDNPLQCTAEIADAAYQTGQGYHGSLSRAETRNFMAAIGPDFKAGFADPDPVSNADIAQTLAHIGGIDLPAKGALKGRVITEALKDGTDVAFTRKTIASAPGVDGLRTVLNEQEVGNTRYFDAAGFAGRTVGLSPP